MQAESAHEAYPLPGSAAKSRIEPPLVTLVCHTLKAGGAEKQLLLIAKALLELGGECEIRTLVNPIPAPSLQPLLEELNKKHNLAPKKFSLRRAILDRRPGHTWWAWGRRADLVLKFWKPLLGGSIVCSLRDSDKASMQKYRAFDRAFHRRVDRYISNTSRACRELSRFVPAVHERSTILLNALPNRVHFSKNSPLGDVPFQVAMLGNILVQTKGYDVLLELGELLARNKEPILVNVAGRDESQGRFAALIKEKGLNEYIKYHGPVDSPLSFLATNHAFLLLSRHEGTPNALLEAMSLGLPCIATRVGDLAEHFRDKEHLELLELPDAAQAYAAIQRLRTNREYGRTLGLSGQSRCTALFSYERLKNDLQDLFWPERRL